MTHRFLVVFTLALALTTAALAGAPQADRAALRLEAAAQKATVEGDLAGAIKEYEAIVSAYSQTNRPVAAQALLRVAEAYQKLDDARAQAVYQRIVRDFGDQADMVAVARGRIHRADSATATRQMGLRKLWNSKPEQAFVRSVTPDGRRVVFVDADGDLSVTDLASGVDRRLTNMSRSGPGQVGAAQDAVVSRDGGHVAFSWFVEAKDRFELRVVPMNATETSTSTTLVDNEDIVYASPFDWSPDGRWIAVQLGRRDHTRQIALVDSRNGALRVLTSIDWRGVLGLKFSPDGRYLAYDLPVGDALRERDLFVLSVDASRQTTVDTHAGYDTVLGWSADGRTLLFTSDRSGSMAIWGLPMETGVPSRPPSLVYADLGTFAYSVGLTAAGDLTFMRKVGVTNTFAIALDFTTGARLGEPEPLTKGYLWDHRRPAWSPDGASIMYMLEGQTERSLVVQDLASGRTRDITPRMSSFLIPSWSSNRFILFQGRDLKGRQGIYRIDVNTGDVSPVAHAVDAYLSYASSTPDGRFVVFGRNPDGEGPATIEVKDTVTGDQRVLVTGGGNASVSPDGRLVAYFGGDEKVTRIFVVALSGGTPTEVINGPPPNAFDGLRWLPDSRRLLTRDNPRRLVMAVPIDGGPAVDLAMPADARALIAHPDGKRIGYLAGNSAYELWILEIFLPAR